LGGQAAVVFLVDGVLVVAPCCKVAYVHNVAMVCMRLAAAAVVQPCHGWAKLAGALQFSTYSSAAWHVGLLELRVPMSNMVMAPLLQVQSMKSHMHHDLVSQVTRLLVAPQQPEAVS
jgi:hypothetical protein